MKPTSKKKQVCNRLRKINKKRRKIKKTSKIKIAKPTNKIKMERNKNLNFKNLGSGNSPLVFRGRWANTRRVASQYFFCHSLIFGLCYQGGSSLTGVRGSSRMLFKKIECLQGLWRVLEGIKMNSCACLLDPKKIPMCVIPMCVMLVWLFRDGCFC